MASQTVKLFSAEENQIHHFSGLFSAKVLTPNFDFMKCYEIAINFVPSYYKGRHSSLVVRASDRSAGGLVSSPDRVTPKYGG